ncbi:MAG: hypothetical protein QM723_16185 [Myxococcaceae bacterium]
MTHSGPIDLDQLDVLEMPTERRIEVPRTRFYLWVTLIGGVLAAALLAGALVYANQSPAQPQHTTVQEVPSPYAPGNY